MASISSASYSALRSLQSINTQLDATQNRISTGYKVASAKDGAGAWTAALALRSDIKTSDALTTGITSVQSAAEVYGAAADSIIEALTSMKSLANKYANTADATEQAQIFKDITAAQNQIKAAAGVTVKGAADWMTSATAGTVTVGYASGGAAITQSITKAVIATVTDSTAVGSAAGATVLATGDIDTVVKAAAVITGLDTAIASMTTFATNMGALSSGLDTAKAFLNKISDIKQSALSKLVDADMEKESALLSSLQVKQSLATQALSIANSSGQNVLRLFQ